MPKNTRHIKKLEKDLNFKFPEEWWFLLADELGKIFGDDTLNFNLSLTGVLSKIGHKAPFKAWAITIGNTVYITKAFAWENDLKVNWRLRFKDDFANLAIILSVLAHEIYHVKDQKRVGFWKWMLKYIIQRPFYTAKTHPMEVPGYEFAKHMKQIFLDDLKASAVVKRHEV